MTQKRTVMARSEKNPEDMPKSMIVVDWGTTSLRASHVDCGGTVRDEVETPRGIQSITDRDFEGELLKVVSPWLEKHGPLPIIALGMITSRNGWVEVPYVACPAGITDLAAGAIRRDLPNGSSLVLLPGITDKTRKPFPDVMRGEETQIVGFGLGNPATLVLPGTHSKWARVSGGRIECFQTFVTGEIFALLSRYSFIAKAAPASTDQANWPAFDRGVTAAQAGEPGDNPLLTLLFSARTGMLANQLEARDIRDYLSGVLIGAEFSAARDCGWLKRSSVFGIVGNDGLNERYGRAARILGLTVDDGGEHAAIAGAIAIANRMPEFQNAIA